MTNGLGGSICRREWRVFVTAQLPRLAIQQRETWSPFLADFEVATLGSPTGLHQNWSPTQK